MAHDFTGEIPMSGLLPRLLFMLFPLLLLSSLSACNSAPTAFRLYYGNDEAVLQSMLHARGKAVLVLDNRALTAPLQQRLLQRAASQQHIVLGYISIGELDHHDLARAQSIVGDIDSTFINWNEKFSSWRVDVSHPSWSRWVHSELQRIADAGFNGFFLDTPDTVDHYITHTQWNRAERGEKVRAMVQLIRSVKQQFPHHFVVLNRGLNLVGESIWMDENGHDTEAGLTLMQARADNPDAILYENAFASSDAWSLRIEADLLATAKTGRTRVFALGYADTLGSADVFFTRAKQAGFVAAWANSSTDLHQHATQSP